MQSDKDTATGPEQGPAEQTGGSRSQRVRELPPPPKSPLGLTGSAQTPEIEADRSTSTVSRGWWAKLGRRQSSSCLASFALHFAMLVGLAMLVETTLPKPTLRPLIASFDTSEPLSEMGQNSASTVRIEPSPLAADVPNTTAVNVAASILPKVPHPNQRSPGTSNDPKLSAGAQARRSIDWMQQTDAPVDGALDGRGREAKAGLVANGGGSPGSELAVGRGLRWLMAHQLRGGSRDGSWDFDHTKGICQGQCADPGTEGSSTGA
ncbi:MAG TPA: hypothetical protein VE890_08585, partial [Thermoguttaceae bacterium]|nr:hypothetical protein [Thermoguttaceae bacterium]